MRIFYHICLFLIVIVIFAGNTYIVQTNAETLNNEEEYIREDDYENIQNSLDDLEVENYFDFKKCVEDINLNGLSGISEYLEYFKLGIKDEISNNKKIIVMIAVAALISAVCGTLFQNISLGDMSSIGGYVAYLVVCMAIIKVFYDMQEIALYSLAGIKTFMKAFIPAYSSVTIFAKGSLTATGYYTLAMIFLLAINVLLINIIIPSSGIYILLGISGNLYKENNLSKMCELVEKCTVIIVKVLIIMVGAFSLIQRMILPYQDLIKRQTALGVFKNLPAVGSSISGLNDLVFSSAILLKNSVGVAGMIAIILVLYVPVLKLVVTYLVLKMIAALTQPIAQKQIPKVIETGAHAIGILIMALLTGAGIFLIMLAFSGAD